jgi:hypothetical protein
MLRNHQQSANAPKAIEAKDPLPDPGFMAMTTGQSVLPGPDLGPYRGMRDYETVGSLTERGGCSWPRLGSGTGL